MADLNSQSKDSKNDLWESALFSEDVDVDSLLATREEVEALSIPKGSVKLNHARPLLLKPISLPRLATLNSLLLPVAVFVLTVLAGSWLTIDDRAGKIVEDYNQGFVRLTALPLVAHYVVEDLEASFVSTEYRLASDTKAFAADQAIEVKELTSFVGGSMTASVKEAGEMVIASVISVVQPVAQSVYNFLSAIWIFISNAFKDMYQSWRYFLGLDKRPEAPVSTVLSETEKEALKAELTEEILKNLKDMGVSNVQQDSKSGVVVLPLTGSTTADEVKKKSIKDSFSDNVIINLDDDGKSGTVVPVFRDGRKGEPYMFVVTPEVK